MRFVCVEHGYCGSLDADGVPRHVDDFLPNDGLITADGFVDLLFEAEGHVEEAHRPALKAAFVRCLGAECVEARQLRWSALDEVERLHSQE